MTQRDDRWHWNETRWHSVISTDSYEYKDSITQFYCAARDMLLTYTLRETRQKKKQTKKETNKKNKTVVTECRKKINLVKHL